jgi:hypothetical protein
MVQGGFLDFSREQGGERGANGGGGVAAAKMRSLRGGWPLEVLLLLGRLN